jgi:hypothetical protein
MNAAQPRRSRRAQKPVVTARGSRSARAARRATAVVATALLVAAGQAALSAQASSVATGSPTAAPAAAPESDDLTFWARLKFGATLEGYYAFNTNRPPNRVTPLRAYDTRSGMFALQQAALVFDSPVDVANGRRFGLRLDLQFGQAVGTVQGNAANEPRPELYRNVWQAYGSYVFPVGRGLTVDFGKFASSLGMETNYAKDNQDFSRSFLFHFLPSYHTGLRVSVPVGERVTLTYALTNGIQQTEDFNGVPSHHVVVVVTPVPTLTWTMSVYAGREQPDGGQPDGPDGPFRVFDSYVSWTPGARVTLGADINHTSNRKLASDLAATLTGAAAYARVHVAPRAALSARYEWIDDRGGLFAGSRQRVQEVTATAELQLQDGFAIRGEVRRDWSTGAIFPGSGGDAWRRSQTTVMGGLVWWLGNKLGTW